VIRRRVLPLVLTALAGASVALWAGVRYTRQVESEIQGASADKLTLRFFRNPSSVSFSVRDLDGRLISSENLKGKVVLVNFWATWCPPCRAEIPDLVALQEKYRDRLQIIGISEDEGPPDLVRRFAAQHRMNYPTVMRTTDIERIFPGVYALPTTFVLDREARLVQRHTGLLVPAVTEMETQALAGLRVNASIEEVDRGQPLKLENAAQITSIPGVDLGRLSADRRVAAVQRLNAEPCTCGCELSVAKCRIDDPDCGVSLPIARRIVAEIAAGAK
jgi:thiol-disulfide isomerase/thioredoxin